MNPPNANHQSDERLLARENPDAEERRPLRQGQNRRTRSYSTSSSTSIIQTPTTTKDSPPKSHRTSDYSTFGSSSNSHDHIRNGGGGGGSSSAAGGGGGSYFSLHALGESLKFCLLQRKRAPEPVATVSVEECDAMVKRHRISEDRQRRRGDHYKQLVLTRDEEIKRREEQTKAFRASSKSKIESLNQTVKYLEEALREETHEREQKEQVIEKFKAAAFKKTEDYGVMDDNRVAFELETILGGVKDWAKRHFKKPIPDLDEKELEQIVPLLDSFLQHPGEVIFGNPNFRTNLLVRAAVTELLKIHIFEEPFLGLGHDFEQLMKGLYQASRLVDIADAEKLRCDTLRMIQKLNDPKFSARRSRHFEKLTLHIDGHFSVLAEPEEKRPKTERLKELHEIVSGAGALADALGRQRSLLNIYGKDYFVESPNFSSESDFMVDCNEDEDYPDRSNGRRIVLVVSPAILKCGSEDGDHYDKKRCWSPAIVLLQHEKEIPSGEKPKEPEKKKPEKVEKEQKQAEQQQQEEETETQQGQKRKATEDPVK